MITIEQVPAYVVWPVRHEVMYPDLDFESIKLAEDEGGIHLALFEESTLVSVVSLFRAGSAMQFRKFATIKKEQGKGYGAKLLGYVIEVAKQENCDRLWCNARESAATFYSKFGFKETDQKFFKDGYNFVVMELLLK